MMAETGKQEYTRLTEKRVLFIVGLILILIALAGVAVTLGSANLSVADSYLAILAGLFPDAVDLPDRMIESNAVGIVWGWRLHRVLFGIAAGFGLAIAGTVMQGVLRNPLASPFTLGIASAASCGASIAIVLGAGILSGSLLVIGNAFLFAMLAAAAIYGMARLRGMGSEAMILAGIALMYLFSAITSLLQYLGTAAKVQEVVFWMFGSLDKSSWPKLGIVAIVIVAVIPPLLWRAWDLNALAEGDEVAASLGVPVERSMAGFMLAASLVTAVIICFTGTIGFIGLVAPHITRMAIGTDHRTLLPASGLVGAVLLLGADCLARTLIPGAIIPVGIMTAFLGIPFFLYLFMRGRDA
ncbi:MAG TPA: iron ABC transporter permease [Methanoculleus sp.]|jgi:iron complex transport system permease protein|uniref:FecCD family ABC transporter permease n=1 Tax=Methanoculleus sp. TaxID=90427 RepID=UPI001B60FF1F|nr:iron ABC transporter permease [Methanoculleus sp.]MBP7144531.1 iron ABC transporter permease [Methanoculleus sp.]HOC85134.1 iron ABC transporter permease [Methanoculleus sp.]HOF97434.1 iron ABC transporter permease [Methanoculleus sp.]HOI61730.1 iron ABC transporter permease [Methanoculleus sp.]HOS68086.1 iron ABC transporter permease [Methanoculleus sp.]